MTSFVVCQARVPAPWRTRRPRAPGGAPDVPPASARVVTARRILRTGLGAFVRFMSGSVGGARMRVASRKHYSVRRTRRTRSDEAARASGSRAQNDAGTRWGRTPCRPLNLELQGTAGGWKLKPRLRLDMMRGAGLSTEEFAGRRASARLATEPCKCSGSASDPGAGFSHRFAVPGHGGPCRGASALS